MWEIKNEDVMEGLCQCIDWKKKVLIINFFINCSVQTDFAVQCKLIFALFALLPFKIVKVVAHFIGKLAHQSHGHLAKSKLSKKKVL